MPARRLWCSQAPAGGPLFRSTFGRHVWKPAVARAGLEGFTFHGLRHSFVAILVAAGCNVREVSEWAGHNSVAFTLTRYGGLFEDGSDEAVDRLDALLSGRPERPNVRDLRRHWLRFGVPDVSPALSLSPAPSLRLSVGM